jgi:hypothetical protein
MNRRLSLGLAALALCVGPPCRAQPTNSLFPRAPVLTRRNFGDLKLRRVNTLTQERMSLACSRELDSYWGERPPIGFECVLEGAKSDERQSQRASLSYRELDELIQLFNEARLPRIAPKNQRQLPGWWFWSQPNQYYRRLLEAPPARWHGNEEETVEFRFSLRSGNMAPLPFIIESRTGIERGYDDVVAYMHGLLLIKFGIQSQDATFNFRRLD